MNTDNLSNEGGKCGEIECVDARKVYNLPLYEVYLVIDCRQSCQYDQGHIASAMNFPPSPTQSARETSLIEFGEYVSNNFCHERWEPIVLYGDNDEEVQEHLQWTAKRLKSLVGRDILCNSPSAFLRCLSQNTTTIWILDSGFEFFITEYPSLCYKPSVENLLETGANYMKPLPYHVSMEGKGIFIGSRALQNAKELIEEMNIESVVLDEVSVKMFNIEHVSKPLESFICSIGKAGDEENTQQLTTYTINRFEELFESVTEFIQTALQSDRRVLIQMQSRSHSADIAIAWYMRYKHMNYYEAKSVLCACTLRNARNPTSSVLQGRVLPFQKELLLWQKSVSFSKYCI